MASAGFLSHLGDGNRRFVFLAQAGWILSVDLVGASLNATAFGKIGSTLREAPRAAD
jgi:hypothetical protein